MRELTLLITFDYELFLGQRSGRVDQCVVSPTAEILRILASNDASGIFFVDTTWLRALATISNNDRAASRDYDAVRFQLNEIAEAGHSVFPHLHPHWLDAQYQSESAQWQLNDLQHYRFHSLSGPQKLDMFADAVAQVAQFVGNQPVDAYRAGGWSLQPFADFAPFFKQFGIQYDFSVLPGFSCSSTAQQYDFPDAPADRCYCFTHDPAVEDTHGGFTELPISTVPFSDHQRQINRMTTRVLHRCGVRSYGRGRSVNPHVDSHKTPAAEMAAVESLTLPKSRTYLNTIRQRDYFQFICHPKMVSRHSLWVFDRLLRNLKRTRRLDTDFRNYVMSAEAPLQRRQCA
ncbi:MAG: hypothetical protein ABGZ53_07665 [Fuerstiella sp.]